MKTITSAQVEEAMRNEILKQSKFWEDSKVALENCYKQDELQRMFSRARRALFDQLFFVDSLNVLSDSKLEDLNDLIESEYRTWNSRYKSNK